MVLAALVYGGRELYLRFTHIYEYDARVTADIVTISSRADGWVVDMPVREGMRVAAGQVVAQHRRPRRQAEESMRSRPRSRACAPSARGSGPSDGSSVNQADALAKTRTSMRAGAREGAGGARKSDLDFAKGELDAPMVAVRAPGLQRARSSRWRSPPSSKLESQLQQARRRARAGAEGSLEEAKVEQDKLGVIDAQIAALDHQVANLAAQMHQQNVDVEDRTIKSPIPAVIDRTFVLPGEYVQSGQRILLLHNPDEVWVEANIKETQVGR